MSTSITDILYDQNYSVLINYLDYDFDSESKCKCDNDGLQYVDHWCPDSATLYVYKTIVRVSGNPVKMTPDQADYQIFSWQKSIDLDYNPTRDIMNPDLDDPWMDILYQIDYLLTDDDLITQFTISSTQDLRDLEKLHRPSCDKVNQIRHLKISNDKFNGKKKKAAYFHQLMKIIDTIYSR